jgi:hypothetical protein
MQRHCFMAADSRRVGPSFVKAREAAGFAGAGEARGLDQRWPPGTLAAKKAMADYQ